MHTVALTTALNALEQRTWWAAFEPQAGTIQGLIRSMRFHAYAGNKEMFTSLCQEELAGVNGDAMCEILDELYSELGVKGSYPNEFGRDIACWDDFEEQFLDWTPERALVESTTRPKWSPLG